MVDMKHTKKDLKKHKKEMEICCEREETYPWGLCINLENESIEKLNIKELPEVGEDLMITAKVKVTRVSTNETVEGNDRKEIGLQITEMEILPKVKKEREKLFYGDK